MQPVVVELLSDEQMSEEMSLHFWASMEFTDNI